MAFTTQTCCTYLLCCLFVYTSVQFAAADIEKVGNSILAGRATIEENTVFLLDEAFDVDGVIFAISAYFTGTNPVRFQIWRPVDPDNTSSGYTLMGQWTYSAIKAGRREDIYLNLQSGGNCFRISPHDRIGLYLADSPGSVAYDFISGNPTTLRKEVDPPSELNDVLIFDTLQWPYKFSLAAYVDTDLSGYPDGVLEPTCRPGLAVPLEDEGYENTPLPPSTPQPGATGATGPMGAAGPEGDVGATGSAGPQGTHGEIGATGVTGEQGPEGEMGANGSPGRMGEIGPIGPQGGTGSTGPAGQDGQNGERGPPGPAGNVTYMEPGNPAGQTGGCTWCATFEDPYLILGVVIWLAVVTLLLFIVIIVISCRRQKAAQQPVGNGSNDNLWNKYPHHNGGFDNEKSLPHDDNTYTAIAEGRTEF